MLREPGKPEQSTEVRKQVNKKQRRFRIVKLEERIAPASKHGGNNGNGKTGAHDQCNAP
jgi:hypothetical protein